MWLIDENLHVNLHRLLGTLGVQAQSAAYAGLSGFDNGALVEAASSKGFQCILTQDKTFADDAASALSKHPQMAVVLITLSQLPSKTYLTRFETAWKKSPIVPVAGKKIGWPSQ